MAKLLVAVAVGVILGGVWAGSVKKEKNLSIVNIIKFENGPCNSSTNLNGTCYTSQECEKKGGLASGSCASGFGVCCTFEGQCGGVSSENNTYFKSVTSTSVMKAPCNFKVCPMSKKICQLRLDFSTFEIAQPDTTSESAKSAATDGVGGSWMTAKWFTSHPNSHGKCLTEAFSVTSPGKTPPVICGTNSGQHMYVDADGMTCNQLSFTWMTFKDQRWNIKIAQIECGADWAAPQGCLQYFTSATAEIQSFNFDKSIHLADQDYDICIKTQSKKCKICYTQKSAGDFQVSKVGTTKNVGSSIARCNAVRLLPSDPPKATEANNIERGNDWVTIVGGATTAGALVGDRFCGLILHGDISKTAAETVCSSVMPFKVGVHFDGNEAAGSKAEVEGALAATTRGDKGFRLIYDQKDC